MRDKYEKDSGVNVNGDNKLAEASVQADKDADAYRRQLSLINEINEALELQRKNAKGLANDADFARFRQISSDIEKAGGTESVKDAFSLAADKMMASKSVFEAWTAKADAAKANFNAAVAQLDANRKMGDDVATRNARSLATGKDLEDFSKSWEESRRMAERPRSFEELPSPMLQAEEIFGSKSVAGSGPAGWVESQKDNTEALKDNTATLKAAQALSTVLGKVPTIAIQGGF